MPKEFVDFVQRSTENLSNLNILTELEGLFYKIKAYPLFKTPRGNLLIRKFKNLIKSAKNSQLQESGTKKKLETKIIKDKYRYFFKFAKK